MVLRTLVSMLLCVFAASTAIGCVTPGENPPEPQQCYLTPDAPGCSCDDEDPCTADVREFDGCKHDYVTYGDPCIGQDGFCDVGAVCRQECDKAPCLDWTVQTGYGCVYSVRPNGWTCTDDIGQSGTCDEGSCVAPPTACTAEETKCRTDEIASGWCGSWGGSGTSLSCKRCVEIECGGVPGCAPNESGMCQGGNAAGGCPVGCCPVCFS